MRSVRAFLARIAAFVSRSRWERELTAEMQSNLELHIEDLMRSGMSAHEARRAAVLRFGGIAQAKETYRDRKSLPALDAMARDLRDAIRAIRRNPGFSTVVITTLALGIGANTAIFSVVKAVLLTNLPYADADRLVTIAQSDPDSPNAATVDFTTAHDWRERSHSFEHMALFRNAAAALTGPNGPELLRGMRVSYDYFDTLGVKVLIGRTFAAEEDRPDRRHVAILTHGLWQRRFGGEPAVLGRQLRLSDSSFTVVGVLPASFRPIRVLESDPPPDIFFPLGYALSDQDACRGCQHLHMVARLRRGTSVPGASAELNTIMRAIVAEHPDKYRANSSVSLAALRDETVKKVRTALWTLLGAVGFVLLIACANVMNLVLVRGAARVREISLRAALGAARSTLMRQLLTESVLLAIAGGSIGMALAFWGTPRLASLAPPDLPRLDEVKVDWVVLLVTLAASAFCGILFGLVPALRSSRADLNAGLRAGPNSTLGRSHSRLRDALVTLEFALAFVLALGAGVLGKSFLRLMHVDPGYDPRNVVTLNTYVYGEKYQNPAAELNYYDEARSRVLAIPGVQDAAYASTLPLVGFDRRGFHILDRPYANEADAPSVDGYSVSPDYFRVMKIALRRGRLFTAADRMGTALVAIISESCARREFPAGGAIGKAIKLGSRGGDRPWATIVGIVGDVRQYGLDRESEMEAYVPLAQNLSFAFSMVARVTGDPARFETALRAAFASADPNLPVYNVLPLERYLKGTLAERTFTLALLGMFCVLAVVLAGVGIYGAMAYSVTLRSREVGIRMALGAHPATVLRSVLSQGLAITAAGMVLGFAVSAAVSRLLGSLLYNVRPLDAPALVIVAITLAATSMAATYVPARRASRMDPLITLRQN